MANIMNKVRFNNTTHRSGFDLSHKNAFSAKVGELLPVLCEEVLPGDKFDIKPSWFTRTMPLKTSAYSRLQENIDFFFVPARLLWKYSDTFFAGIPNYQSAVGITTPNNNTFNNQPYFKYSDVATLLSTRNSYALSGDPKGRNIFNYGRGFNSAKLLEYLGYGKFTDMLEQGYLSAYNTTFNPFPLLAYQKIYQDYYRNDHWETARPDFYNLDYISNSSLPMTSLSLLNSTDDMFDLRYVNYKKDLFTGLLPNSQYGDEAIIDFDVKPDSLFDTITIDNPKVDPLNVASGQNLAIRQRATDGRLMISDDNQTPVAFLSGKLSTALSSTLSVLALRKAQALQRRNEITQSHKYDYKHQTEAHWNVNVSDSRSGLCQFIRGFNNRIDINEVVNTNLTDGNAANIQGKGSGAATGSFEFGSNEHGYLLGIYYCTPELDYIDYGVNKLNTKYQFSDFAIPEFDNLGMEQVPLRELILDGALIDAQVQQGFLGYAPRYYEYKTRKDVVRGGLSSIFFSEWVTPLSRDYLVSLLQGSDDISKSLLNRAFFKVNPNILNPITVSQVTTDISVDGGNEYVSEQLLINLFFDFKAVRNLDYNGLPY